MRARALLLAAMTVVTAPASRGAEAGSGATAERPARVSLAADQTPLRNQRARGTCTAVAAIAAPRFHRVADYRWIYLGRREEDPTYADTFEEVLASGHEIVWDVLVRGGESAPVWRYDLARVPSVPHCMLVVGYDRSSRDP